MDIDFIALMPHARHPLPGRPRPLEPSLRPVLSTKLKVSAYEMQFSGRKTRHRQDALGELVR